MTATARPGCGRLVLSIDLELELDDRLSTHARDLGAITPALVELLRRYDLPATWGLADPAMSAASTLVQNAGVKHEIAILGDRSWVGQAAGRTRFTRELSRRTLSAEHAGIFVRTLLLRGVELGDHHDIAARCGIKALREDDSASGSGQTITPHTRHEGIWEFAVSRRVPQQSGWLGGLLGGGLLVGSLFGGGFASVRRLIASAIRRKGLAHVVIDGPQLLASPGSGMKGVEQLLRFASEKRRRGQLVVETFSAAVERQMPRRETGSMVSILRRAA